MNRNGHIIWSQFFLILYLSITITILLRDYGLVNIGIAGIFGLAVYLLGCTLPDWDHEKVQVKIFFIRTWLWRITHHRGHWHSIVAMLVYGGLIAGLMIILSVVFWFFPPIAGMLGFLSHLIEDDVNRWKLEKKPARGLKFW